MLNVCRICLSSEINKDICQLEIDNTETKSYSEVILFCLGIQVDKDSNITTKLCLTCHETIMKYYKFKTLALQSDAYFKSLCLNNFEELYNVELKTIVESDIKEEINHNDDDDASSHDLNCDTFINDGVECGVVKLELKTEFIENYVSPDEEFFSALKNVEKEKKICKKDSTRKIRKKIKKVTSKCIKDESQICDKCGKLVKNLNEHLTLHESNREKFPCHICNKLFINRGSKYKHIRIKHLGIKKSCKICNKAVTNLRQHILQVHETDQLPHECTVCSRRFISQSTLDSHMTSHTKVRLFECLECGSKYRNKISLNLHKRRVHDKERPFVCHVCSKNFFKKYHLQVHMRSHTKERPYKCEECGKSFFCTSTLKSHQLIHKAVKKYECLVCNMTFLKQGYLSNHMISHTKEKKHACKYCGVKFGRSDHRKRHEYTAHEKHLATAATPSAAAAAAAKEL